VANQTCDAELRTWQLKMLVYYMKEKRQGEKMVVGTHAEK
jgi:hypothetical protein